MSNVLPATCCPMYESLYYCTNFIIVSRIVCSSFWVSGIMFRRLPLRLPLTSSHLSPSINHSTWSAFITSVIISVESYDKSGSMKMKLWLLSIEVVYKCTQHIDLFLRRWMCSAMCCVGTWMLVHYAICCCWPTMLTSCPVLPSKKWLHYLPLFIHFYRYTFALELVH